MTSPSSAIVPVILQLLIVLVIVRRSLLMSHGVPFSMLRLVLLPALLVLLWGITELESVLLIPGAFPYLVGLDAAVLASTALLFAEVAERRTEVFRDPAGKWSFRIGFSFTALFVAAFLVRLALAEWFYPASLSFGGAPPGGVASSQEVALALIDGIFSMSVGLLAGRSLGILRKMRASRPEND